MKKLNWLVVGLGIWLVTFGLNQLTHNANQAKSMAREVLIADQAGKDARPLLEQLRQFSASHLNASVQLTLESSYARATDAAKASAVPDVSGEVYAQAQRQCARGDSVAQSECVRQYVSGRLKTASGQVVPLPDLAQYQYSFKSPAWALDGAGASISLGSILILAGFFNWLPRTSHRKV